MLLEEQEAPGTCSWAGKWLQVSKASGAQTDCWGVRSAVVMWGLLWRKGASMGLAVWGDPLGRN